MRSEVKKKKKTNCFQRGKTNANESQLVGRGKSVEFGKGKGNKKHWSLRLLFEKQNVSKVKSYCIIFKERRERDQLYWFLAPLHSANILQCLRCRPGSPSFKAAA